MNGPPNILAGLTKTALLLLVLAFSARADDFDDAISAVVSGLKVRGGAIAYFDSTKGMTDPLVRGYGRVSSASRSAPVTPDTTFMLASISKVFTASAVAVLVDLGVISLDDDICDVVPKEYGRSMCRNPRYPNDSVTWRMMITHRSSLARNIPGARDRFGDWINPSYGPSGGYSPDAPAAGNPTCPLEGVVDFYHALLTDDNYASTEVGAGLKLMGGKELNWYDLGNSNGGMWKRYRPGSGYEYSNLAYGYLAGLIELATGQSFPEFCSEQLFQPLGMSRTAWFRDDLPGGTLEAVPGENRKRGFKDVGHYCYIDYASGELRTSARDLARWGNAMLRYGSPALWSSTIGREVVACQERTSNGGQVNNCEHGYGWILLDNSMKKSGSVDGWLKNGFSSYDWTDGIWHDGAESGSQTNLIILPKAGLYVAVVTNTDYNSERAPYQLTRAVVEAPLPPLGPTPAPPTAAPKPTPAPPTHEPPTYSGNCLGQAEFMLKLKTDEWPVETKWELKRDKTLLKKRKFGFYKGRHSHYEESMCVPLTGEYQFRIFDDFEDGICCKAGNGSYEVYLDGVLKKKGGKFGWQETTSWSA